MMKEATERLVNAETPRARAALLLEHCLSISKGLRKARVVTGVWEAAALDSGPCRARNS